jgi:hypothetical protein
MEGSAEIPALGVPSTQVGERGWGIIKLKKKKKKKLNNKNADEVLSAQPPNECPVP